MKRYFQLINYKARIGISKGVGVYRIIDLSGVVSANERGEVILNKTCMFHAQYELYSLCQFH